LFQAGLLLLSDVNYARCLFSVSAVSKPGEQTEENKNKEEYGTIIVKNSITSIGHLKKTSFQLSKSTYSLQPYPPTPPNEPLVNNNKNKIMKNSISQLLPNPKFLPDILKPPYCY